MARVGTDDGATLNGVPLGPWVWCPDGCYVYVVRLPLKKRCSFCESRRAAGLKPFKDRQ